MKVLLYICTLFIAGASLAQGSTTTVLTDSGKLLICRTVCDDKGQNCRVICL